ncbi:MAG TPA: class I SAM-dependent methyltransferase [Polyangia bacterium]|jgi:SAM-dependent methyltransferase|nr:class I SAM-dependent methyltransferase [Polyangia bacterium]
MSLGRRKVALADQTRWVFNRMADVYPARPPYPTALIDALADLVRPGARVGDLGAGIGHVALPLAARGFAVEAIEPAASMLGELRVQAARRRLAVRAHHATAEALPVATAALELVVVADALHFLDAELTAREIDRVLAPGGALAVITCGFAETPYMRGVVRAMNDAVPRRPRALGGHLVHVSAITGVAFTEKHRFVDETPVDPPTLERILRSISFIGPAMNAARFAAFRDQLQALPGPPLWGRTFVLHTGRRRN